MNAKSVIRYLYWTIGCHYGIKPAESLYEHHSESVVKGADVIILWDFSINTDRTIHAIQSDIVFKKKKKRKSSETDWPERTKWEKTCLRKKKKQMKSPGEGNRKKRWLLKTKMVSVVVLDWKRKELKKKSAKSMAHHLSRKSVK